MSDRPALVLRTLDAVYSRAVEGVAGMDSAEQLAADYRAMPGTLRGRIDRLVRFQNAKAATTGFVTGVGGGFTLPVALPAGFAGVLFIQLRTIAAIAHLCGHDVRHDAVRTLCYACLCGNAVGDVLKTAGIEMGNRAALAALKKLPGRVLTEINKKVGFRLATKFGEKGVVNLGKLIPLAGGLVGGLFDAATTNAVGNAARDTFLRAG